MTNNVWKRLMVVSSCGLLLSSMPVVQAEELLESTDEQVTTVETPSTMEKQENEKQEVTATEAVKVEEPDVQQPNVQQKSDEDKVIATPVLKGVKDQTIKAGTTFDPKAGVTATDETEGDLTKQIQITGTVDSLTVGSYSLTYSVKNSQGKTASKTVTIQVEKEDATDRTSVRRNAYTMEIADFTTWRSSDLKAQIMERLVLTDINGDLATLDDVDTFTIDRPKASDTVGTKKLKLSVTASDGTVSEKMLTVTVVNELRIETKDFSNRGDLIDLFEGIQAIETRADGSEVELGSYDPTTKTGIEVIKNRIDMKTPGEYELVYRVHSSLGEIVDRRVTVTVVKTLFPQVIAIEVSDQVMTVGDVLTNDMILGWAKVDSDCILSFDVLDQGIPVDSAQRLTTAGTYRIRYTASMEEMPSSDLAVYEEMTLTVRERVTYSTNQNQTIRTIPQYGSVSTAKQLPKTGETTSSWIHPLLGFTLLGFVAFLKRERLLSKLSDKK